MTRTLTAFTFLASFALGCAAGDDLTPSPIPDASRGTDVVPSPRDARSDTRTATERPPDAIIPPEAATDRVVPPDDDQTPDLTPDGGASMPEASTAMPTLGTTMRVTATALNLRAAIGTGAMVLTTMPCGASVTVLEGPSMGWWRVRYNSTVGWASGAYLVAASAFDMGVCGAGSSPPPTTPTPLEVSRIFELARPAVGFSYWWGHGVWNTQGIDRGTCTGSCPSCTHTGRYGADCSGFVAKVWQIPSPSPVTTDLHPYSTYDFYNSTRHWSRVPRPMTRPGDAMVYNANGSGHIFLVESGSDPWGSVWAYEARGCATGIVHNLRSVPASYVTIRREGL